MYSNGKIDKNKVRVRYNINKDSKGNLKPDITLETDIDLSDFGSDDQNKLKETLKEVLETKRDLIVNEMLQW